jgi:hypothetical protein
MAKERKKTKQVESLKHRDKRKNIPTEELRDFVTEDEEKPPVVLYPRDLSLDPQFVWKGKDEQDAEDLAVFAGLAGVRSTTMHGRTGHFFCPTWPERRRMV